MRNYETFSTTADTGIRFRGRGHAELYANALRGLNLLLFGRNPRLAKQKGTAIPFRFRGDGPENVLVNLLAAAVALAGQEGQQVTATDIRRADGCRLDALLLTAPCPRLPRIDVKAVTYHDLRVRERNGVLRAAVVLDI